MTRFLTATLAAGCALTISVGAQDTKTRTTTEVKGGDVKTVTYTGCVGAGTETKTYILDKAVPVSRTTTETIGTAGSTSTTTVTRYVLVPAERVEVQQHVGHKVEVTGLLIPAGDVRIKTETKVEREDAKDTKTTEVVKSDNAMPQFRVTSIKSLGERCE